MTRKDVPAQKPSIADPLSFWVMIGSAILRDVASKAAAKVIMQIEPKASRKALPGLKGARKLSRDETSLASGTNRLSGRVAGKPRSEDNFSSSTVGETFDIMRGLKVENIYTIYSGSYKRNVKKGLSEQREWNLMTYEVAIGS